MLVISDRRFLCLFFISLIPVLLFGQYYNLGQDPSTLKWRWISTQKFNLIYPENYEQKAQKLIQSLENVCVNETKTLGYIPERVPFIIHNYNTESNAVTVWAPKRVELFTCPPQNTYTQDWLEQLMIHEYRHVIQLDRTNQGFTKVLSWFTGEQAAATINGLFVPSWFMEGDAVCTETAFSNSGRGRLPSFEMQLKAQATQKGVFTYDKAVLGSYKSFVPDQYHLGYALVANVRRKYGYQAWITTLDEVARKPYLITPFNNGLKKATGFGKENLYAQTMLYMDSLWRFQDKQTQTTRFIRLTEENTGKYENFRYPHFLNDSLVIALYSSLDEISRFELILPSCQRRVITIPGFMSSDLFSISNLTELNHDTLYECKIDGEVNFQIAWTETINDPRWGERKYSEIRIYNSITEKTTDISLKSRYFAPAFSPDGKSLVAVCVDSENKSFIVLIDVFTGSETQTIISSDCDFYMTPSWSEDGKMIVFTKLDVNGKSIIIYNIENQVFTTIVPPSFTEISNPVFAGDYIMFNGSYSGVQNICAVGIESHKIFQVTSSQFGSSNADISRDRKNIVYSEYNSDGFSLVKADFNPELFQPLNEIRNNSPSLYKYLVKEEAVIIKSNADTSQVYESKPYKKGNHLFNFHSWAPAYINYMSGERGAGISVMSQNDLSTATTVAGYKYDLAENTGKMTLDFSWQGWYPVIDLKTSYGNRAVYPDSAEMYTFRETTISGGFTLPLQFTRGRYYKGILLQAFTSFSTITDNTSLAEDKLTGTIQSFDYSVYAYRYIKQAYKDIYPKYGQSISFQFRHSPFGDNDYGSIFSATTRLYFPGLWNHHGLRLDLSWQHKNPGSYAYSNLVLLPRGYNYINVQTLSCYSINYKFPFAYPDFSLGPVVYVKRLKANIFVDGGLRMNDGMKKRLQSAGFEITSDLHLLRFVFPLDIGFRYGYRLVERDFFLNLLFSVNLPG